MRKARTFFAFLLIIISLAVLLFSGYQLYNILSVNHKESKDNEKVTSMINDSAPERTTNDDGILLLYEELHNQNSDMIGWIKIDDTEINYPVMYTPNEPEYYLRRNFYKASAISGTPFVGEGCTVDDLCFVVYGHMMNNNTMFAQIKDYKDKEFWEAHQIVHFDTIYEQRQYQIVAAFYTKIPKPGEEGFRYYDLVGNITEKEFSALKSGITSLQQYNTGYDIDPNKQTLLLSTCSYHVKDGRFVVVAQRI